MNMLAATLLLTHTDEGGSNSPSRLQITDTTGRTSILDLAGHSGAVAPRVVLLAGPAGLEGRSDGLGGPGGPAGAESAWTFGGTGRGSGQRDVWLVSESFHRLPAC